ncbi:hemopexin repeat-containing protein [Hymenobacter volaticus]
MGEVYFFVGAKHLVRSHVEPDGAHRKLLSRSWPGRSCTRMRSSSSSK